MKVLFVDDEEFFRMMVREVLCAKLPDVTVEEASDGASALDALRSSPVDCVVSDLVMPSTDGVALLVAMLNEQIRVPVVLVSAHGGEQLRLPGLPRHVTKPADLGVLCATVAELVADVDAARDAMPTLMGLVHVLRWLQRTCAVEVRLTEGEDAWRATLVVERGRLDAAWLERNLPDGSTALVRGADAAVEAFSASGPRVSIVSGCACACREDDAVGTTIEQLFARASARRKARVTPILA